MTIESGHLSPPSVRSSEARALDFDRPLMHFNEQTFLAGAANRLFALLGRESPRMDHS